MKRYLTAAVVILTLGATACTRTVEVPASADTTPATEAPATTRHTTTTNAPQATDGALNAAWAVKVLPLINDLSAQFDLMANAPDITTMIAGCYDLEPLARQFGDGAPDTDAGRHAQAAADFYVRAAQACEEGDLDTSTDLLKRGGAELDLSTAALSAS